MYPPARIAASTLHERLLSQQREARSAGAAEPAPLPASDVIERLVEAAFWASLQREEGRSPKISLAYVPQERVVDPLVLDRRMPLDPHRLTRLAPAVERPGIHLCVSGAADSLHVWGAARVLPELSFVLEVAEPGLLVVKYSRPQIYGKFGNLAVFKGDEIKIVDEDAARRPDCPKVLASLTGAEGPYATFEHGNALVQLALSMRAHGHGGTLLVVPDDGQWQRSIILPIAYRVRPSFTKLAELVRESSREDGWSERVRQAIDGVAGLTAVDGATMVSTTFDVLAFGAKIERAEGASAVREVLLLEPVVGHAPVLVDAAELGGTRHLSAAQFVHDQHDALALVASQDGRFTIFAWSHLESRIHAHRIETLLL